MKKPIDPNLNNLIDDSILPNLENEKTDTDAVNNATIGFKSNVDDEKTTEISPVSFEITDKAPESHHHHHHHRHSNSSSHHSKSSKSKKRRKNCRLLQKLQLHFF